MNLETMQTKDTYPDFYYNDLNLHRSTTLLTF